MARTLDVRHAESDLCVARVPIFRGLTRPEQERVALFARPQLVQAGETVIAPGAPVSRLLVVHSGRLKVGLISAGGQEQILRIAAEGDVVGERAFLTGHPPEEQVVAMQDSRVCVVDHSALDDLVTEHPDIGRRMLRTVSDRLASVERLLAAVTGSDVGARVAAYLLDQPGRVEDGGLVVQLPMAKREVAAYLGTTPETLSRRLARLAEDGVIGLRGRREVLIQDVAALEQVAESGRA